MIFEDAKFKKNTAQCYFTDYPQFLPSHEATDCFAVATVLVCPFAKRDDENLHHIEFRPSLIQVTPTYLV